MWPAEKLMVYIDEHFIEPCNTWHKQLFEELSYSRWAAFEILQSLMDHPFDPPDEVVERFMLKMALYSWSSKDEKKQRIFSIAEDTAEEILYLFRSMDI